MLQTAALVQTGFPSGIAGVVGFAGVIVLAMIVLALGAFAYKSMTGGIEWPDDREPADDEVTKSHNEDDEWDYY